MVGRHDSIDPIRAILEPCGFDSIGRSKSSFLWPCFTACAERVGGVIGEPLQPEHLKGGVFVVLQEALNVPPISIKLLSACATLNGPMRSMRSDLLHRSLFSAQI